MEARPPTLRWQSLAIALAVPLIIGTLGGFVTAGAIPTWYAELEKPLWTPPSWIFGPVWTALYLLMGYASWRVWQEGWSQQPVKQALRLYAIQLAVNLSWSWVFFGLQQPAWALVVILALLGLVALTIRSFRSVDPTAAWLLVPYLAWGIFATFLNYAIWQLNG